MKTATSVALFVALVTHVGAICPGYNFGIGQINFANGQNELKVYDDSCTTVDDFITTRNPCTDTSGIFGCSPPPIVFNEYTSTRDGTKYACRTDPKSGSCGSDKISVCCRNDGK